MYCKKKPFICNKQYMFQFQKYLPITDEGGGGGIKTKRGENPVFAF
jgi:hypothetical protein